MSIEKNTSVAMASSKRNMKLSVLAEIKIKNCKCKNVAALTPFYNYIKLKFNLNVEKLKFICF